MDITAMGRAGLTGVQGKIGERAATLLPKVP